MRGRGGRDGECAHRGNRRRVGLRRRYVVGAVAVVQLVGVPLVVDEACAAAAAVGKVGQPNWEHSHCC